MIPVMVTPLPESLGVRVEVASERVDVKRGLLENFIHVSTPFPDMNRVQRAVRTATRTFELYGHDLDPLRLQANYQRFLSVRAFSRVELALPPTAPRAGDWADTDGSGLGEVSVEFDEDNRVIVSFDDETAHEHADLVAACVERCQGFEGVTEAVQQDRELIVLEGQAIDIGRLERDLLAFVRAELSNRAAADHTDDDDREDAGGS